MNNSEEDNRAVRVRPVYDHREVEATIDSENLSEKAAIIAQLLESCPKETGVTAHAENYLLVNFSKECLVLIFQTLLPQLPDVSDESRVEFVQLAKSIKNSDTVIFQFSDK